MADTVLVIADGSDLAPLADALSARGFVARGLSLDAVPPGLDLTGVGAIVVGQVSEPPQQAVARLLKDLGAAIPPIVAVVPEGDRGLRDKCLIAGACDVATGPQPEDIAGRVDAAVNGWLRATPRRKLQTTLRAQRGRQLLDLQVVDIDPSGFGIVPITGVPAGSLLRTNLVLPDGEMLTWGRLALGEDGVQGIRFVALLPEDRKRLTSAVKSRPTASIPPRSMAAAKPAEVSPAPAGPPQANGVAPSVSVSEATLSLNSAAVAASLAAATAPPSTDAPAAAVAEPAATQPSITISGRNTGLSAIGDAIGEMLGDAPPKPSAGEAAAPPDPNLPVWPGTLYDQERSLAVLEQACTMGLAGDEEGAPTGERVLSFARTLTPIERRAFDSVPPPELPEIGLTKRCLVVRLRLFAVTAAANEMPEGPGPLATINDGLFGQLNADLKAVNADLQKELDGYIAAAQTERIKEVNVFRNALNKAGSELRGAAARLKSGTREASGSPMLLDAEHKTGSEPAVRREHKEVEKKEEAKNEFVPQKAGSEARRRGARIAIWLVLLIVSAAGLMLVRSGHREQLNPEDFREMQDITGVVFDPKHDKAVLTAGPNWHPDQNHLHEVENFTARMQMTNFVVLTEQHQALAIGKKGHDVIVPKGLAPTRPSKK